MALEFDSRLHDFRVARIGTAEGASAAHAEPRLLVSVRHGCRAAARLCGQAVCAPCAF